MEKENKREIVALVGFCLLFIGLVVYLSYFQIFKADSIKINSYNKRLWMNEEKVTRGSIMDRKGTILAYSEKTEETNNRYYNYGSLYSHIVGYSYREYGKSGLELQYNNSLLDIKDSDLGNDIKDLVLPSSVGNDLRLTIDHDLQKKSRELLEGYNGSIVTMNPKTGEIYSMVSLPDFDTTNLKENWQSIIENNSSVLINRATQGLYEPGSIFKIITTAALLNEENINLNYNCTGSIVIDGFEFNDYGNISHGDIDLSTAFSKSCNTYFIDKTLEMGSEKLGQTAERFMINKKIEFDLPVETSRFDYARLEDTKLAASAIGQGDTQVTPLNMAMIASSIANGGSMMKPILVKEVVSPSGRIIKETKPAVLSSLGDELKIEAISQMMREVVSSGTGTNASIRDLEVFGKTGTAENSSGLEHSWFVGYAGRDADIALAVILEESGLTGGQGAAPIARDLIIYAYNNINFEER